MKNNKLLLSSLNLIFIFVNLTNEIYGISSKIISMRGSRLNGIFIDNYDLKNSNCFV